LYNKSRMTGDCQVRFCERLEGKFLRPTRLLTVMDKTIKTEIQWNNLIGNLKKQIGNINSLIEGWCKKNLVLPTCFCPSGQFGTLFDRTHLQIA
jgi:hypothetical protein